MSAATSSDRFPRLDKYELLDEIGHGGMATVYRARDLRLDRQVAVKIIHKHLRENAEVRRRFVAEAKAVAKLRHPGIVDVYDVSDEADAERYLVVELIRGTTLRKALDEHGRLPPEIGAAITSVLCDAVEHAHSCGVIHRDIKPENVLIDLPSSSLPPPSPQDASTSSSRGRVRIKLTDFGIAKVLDAQGVTSTGQILGSPAHMAPEQIEGGTIGSFTDVFALGVLMYECMVGHLPFQGSNPWQVLRRVLEGHYEPADSERPEVGGRWSSILLRALHVDAEQRLQSASELRALIDAELAALGIDDPRRCLDDFFADPAGFQQRLTVELVPRLIERGERERKKGDVQGAAADFNRALAFRPDDLVILRRVGSLTAQRIWKQRMTRAGAIAVTAFLLGGGSYALTRVLRPAHAVATAGPTAAPTLATNAPSAATVLVPSAHASSSRSADDPRVTPSASAAPPPVGSVPIAVDPPKKAVRKVKLTAAPSGAKLRLDGGEVEWFGATFELTPGSHQVQAYMPNDNVCCEPVTQSITVVAAKDDAEGPQTFTIGLKIKDAKAVLSGAPPDGKVSCDNGLVFAAGKSGVKTMTDLVAKTSCKFMPGGKRVDVTLSAGKTTPIAWLR